MPMRTIEDLLDGYRRFRKGRYGEQKGLYAELAGGQDLEVMLVGCADSRADPSDIFDTAPGELFTVRNVANLVPASDAGESADSVAASLEYAVCVLKVKHVVVMGHAGCGGVGAALTAGAGGELPPRVAPWVAHLETARTEALASDPADPQQALEWAGIRQSLINLQTYPFVQEATASGQLNLHGAWFQIGCGALHWLDAADGSFQPVQA